MNGRGDSFLFVHSSMYKSTYVYIYTSHTYINLSTKAAFPKLLFDKMLVL